MARSMRMLAIAAVLLATIVPTTPARAQTVETVRYGDADGVPLLMDVHRPPAGEENGIGVVVIHGGRWRDGHRQETPAELVAGYGFVAFTVDYRLAPEHPYPASLQDVQMAVRYIREHAEEFGIDPAKIWAFGASAGGHLAALLGAMGEGPVTEDARVSAVVSWSGPMDLERLANSETTLERVVTDFVGCSRAEEPGCAEALRDASPVTHLDPTDPPMFIANSTEEPIPFDQAVVGAQAAEGAGVEHILWPVEGGLHGFSYVRDVLPPTVHFVLNQIEGQDNPPMPPPSFDIPSPTAPPQETASGETGAQPARRERGSALPLVLAILALVVAVVLGAIILLRTRRESGGW
jgi:acetyl esterase